MSYEIIYKIFTIKKDSVYIPFVVMGSNNCYEHSGRRERNLYKASNLFFNDSEKDFKSINDLKKSFKYLEIDKYLNDGNIQGKYKTNQSILKAFCSKIINYKDLNFKPQLSSLYYCKGLDNDQKNKIKCLFNDFNIKDILTTEEEQAFSIQFIDLLTNDLKVPFQEYFKNMGFICYSYSSNEYKIKIELKKLSPIKKTRTIFEIIETLKDYPIININQENINKYKDKTIIIYNMENPIYKGKIKKISSDEYGFFKSNSKRRYYYLSNFTGFKVVV